MQRNQEKYNLTFEDEESISIWKYDISKSTSGPYEVEYRWKKNYDPWTKKKKTLGDLVAEEKKLKRIKKGS